jgi:hypothetical protein
MTSKQALNRMIPGRYVTAALMAILVVLLQGSVVCGCRRFVSDPVTLQSRLALLTNVQAMANSPLGQTGMISSYDRTGGNSDWHRWTKDDIGEDGLINLVNLKGPGVITRIWGVRFSAKEWQFYIDGEKTPRFRGRNIFPGDAPFIEPLARTYSGAGISYVPIPFQKSLRIAVVPAKLRDPYYEVNYEIFPKGTPVESFPQQLSEQELGQLRQTATQWDSRRDVLQSVRASCAPVKTVSLLPGETKEWLSAEGPATLEAFTLQVDMAAEQSPLKRSRALRELVLQFWWDGERPPSVDVPLGDFFGNSAHRREFSSLIMGYLAGTYICRIPMPFARAARATLRNDSHFPVTVGVGYRLGDAPEARALNYFHARWSQAMGQGRPYNLLSVDGPGHYVGCSLNAIGMDGSWFIVEGDDFTMINRESEPSIHGCGMEDYFNGAWYYFGLSDAALHGLLEKRPVKLEQFRFLLPDPVRFDEHISVNWEFGHASRSRGYMSSVAYWYQPTPGVSGSIIPGPARRHSPRGPVKPIGLMGGLFELERLGELAEAKLRCEEFVEEYPEWDLTPLVALRGLAYGEAEEGLESVREDYENVVAAGPGTMAGQQAKSLLWFHEAHTNALLGAHANGSFRLYLDGRPMLEGSNPVFYAVQPVALGPGEHELTAEVSPSRYDAWLSVCLRTHTTNFYSGVGWEVSRRRPAGWPRGYVGGNTGWNDVKKPWLDEMLPRSSCWQFAPNAYVDMQGRMQLLRDVWRGWSGSVGGPTAYLRYRFTIPSKVPPSRQEASLP